MNAAFEEILTPPLRRALDGKAAIALVLIAPTAAWVASLQAYWKQRFGDRWHIFARDGSLRFEHKSSVGNSTVSSLLAEGRPVIGIAASPDILPTALTTSADHTVRLPAPNAAVLRRALESHLGKNVPTELPPAIGIGLDFHDLIAAFRPGSTSRQIINRIARATERLIEPDGGERLPSMQTAFEYGAARLWAMDLAQDVADYRAGRLSSWTQLSRALVVFGETGTGKTTFAKMVAKYLNLPIFIFSIADLFGNSDGALGGVVQATNSVFARAASAGCCVTVLDELDALPNRATLDARGRDWWLPVVTNFMVKLDFARNLPIIFIATTNYINRVDSALLRPGRFERSIEIRRPDLAGTNSILGHHMPELSGADIAELGRLLQGSTGAELMSVARDARRIARREERALRADDVMAVALPDEKMPPTRLRRICVHEAAHAIGILVLGCGKLRGIIVRTHGGAAGRTMTDHDDNDLPTPSDFEARVVTTLCGSVAERLLIGEASVGSGLDRQSDKAVATRLIASLHASGFGGELTFTSDQKSALKAVSRDKSLRRRVEADLVRLEKKAVRLVQRNRRAILAVADALAETRYLSGETIRLLFEDNSRSPSSKS
ncbi:AAA family ATPase [Bradyrhizobium genosp. P]|uniref:AAA family ATPase n=1 Tax=Bradyrhizobium genosp. P TaxID=83641 RepID=UPI003CEE3814